MSAPRISPFLPVLALFPLASCGGAGDKAADAAAIASDAAPPDRAFDVLTPASCALCASYGVPRDVGSVREPLLNELSGLAASRVHPGVLYGHNDDDDRIAQFFAFEVSGRALGRFVAGDGERKIDTEEIAVGPCPAGSCVFLADAGDGGRVQTTPVRSEYALFRFVEPALPEGPPDAITRLPFERFRFRYPDGSHDSEAMVVDPADGRGYLITKVRTGATSVYRLPAPLEPEAVHVAEKVAALPIARVASRDDIQVTAASAHPCGAAVLVRTYSHIYELRRPAGAVFVDAFAAAPTRWPAPAAEAIAYRQDGRGYLTAPEGTGARIAEANCAP